MTNWFDEEIRESLAKENNESNSDITQMKDALSSLGFDVSKIIISEETNLEDNIGKRACVKENIVVAANVLMKTKYNLYHISKVVLPKGYIGIIAGVEDGKYNVDFDANLPIDTSDVVSGYDGTEITYPLDNFKLADSELQIL